MFSPSHAQPTSDFSALKHAIMDDIQAIDDVDDFVSESEDEIIGLVCRDCELNE